VAVELLTWFRQRAGADRLEVEVPQAAPCVLEVLRAAEAELGGLSILEGERLRAGVLVFLREPGGATRRVPHPAAARVEPGQALVLSTAMAGG
jgi:hypothetical protein